MKSKEIKLNIKSIRKASVLMAVASVALGMALPTSAVASDAPTELTSDDELLIHALNADDLSEQGKVELVEAYHAATAELRLNVDIDAGETGYVSTTLPDGTVLSLGAEPVLQEGASARAGLSGQYRIWGNNGYSSHEFYLQFARVSSNSNYTRIVGNGTGHSIGAWGIATYDSSSKFINVWNRTETSAQSAAARGGANFTFFNGLAQHDVGVDAWVYRGNLSTALFG